MTSNQPIEIGKKTLTQKTCISDAVKLWNVAPEELKNIHTLFAMKKATKKFVATLPLNIQTFTTLS